MVSLDFQFPFEDSHVHIKILNDLYAFLLLMCLMSGWPQNQRGYKEIFPPLKHSALKCRGGMPPKKDTSSADTSKVLSGKKTRKLPLSFNHSLFWASLIAQLVKNPPATQGTQVWSLGREDPLEKGMVTHSSILAWRMPWTEEPGRLQSLGLQRLRHD